MESALRSVTPPVAGSMTDLTDMHPSAAEGPLRSDFEPWAVRMEASLHVELNALKRQVSASEVVLSGLATSQADHAAHITALESMSKAHLHRMRQHQLRIEDSENRSRQNNIKLQGIPKATSGTNLRPTVISILNQVLEREVSSPIEHDQVHRVGGQGGGCPRDVLCQVHYYTLNEALLRKAWYLGPVDFDGYSIHLYPDLSRNSSPAPAGSNMPGGSYLHLGPLLQHQGEP